MFAPTDAAFAAVNPDLVAFLFLPENIETLKELLKYHVVSGTVLSGELADGQQVPSLSGEILDIGVDATTGVTVNGVIVSGADVTADNGVIHIIDEVLFPPVFFDLSIADVLFEGNINGIHSIEALDFLLDFAGLNDVFDGPGPFSTCILCVSRDLL